MRVSDPFTCCGLSVASSSASPSPASSWLMSSTAVMSVNLATNLLHVLPSPCSTTGHLTAMPVVCACVLLLIRGMTVHDHGRLLMHLHCPAGAEPPKPAPATRKSKQFLSAVCGVWHQRHQRQHRFIRLRMGHMTGHDWHVRSVTTRP
jgi:hypothetical protein